MHLSEDLRGPTRNYASAVIRSYVKLPNRDNCGISGAPIQTLLRETDELLAIFTTMVSKLRKSGF